MAKGKNVLTTGDVARICNVAPRTVSKWFDSGQLKGYRIPGSKDRRIPVSELVRFMKVNNMPTTALPAGKIRVLVADSNADSASALADALRKKADYDVLVAHDNFEAGSFAQKFVPHVLLISLLAEDINAAGICTNIRNSEELQTIKVIALANSASCTAEQLSNSQSKALLQKGFDACIPNTANIAEVIREIEKTTAIIY
jgi:excisionase family DNA binding protein